MRIKDLTEARWQCVHELAMDIEQEALNLASEVRAGERRWATVHHYRIELRKRLDLLDAALAKLAPPTAGPRTIIR